MHQFDGWTIANHPRTGDPGASGVSFLTSYPSQLREAFGSQYSLVSFDPRGVNNSDLVVDCFRCDTAARKEFTTGFYGEVADASPSAPATHLSAIRSYGKWCTDTLKQNNTAKYISTPAVAHDLLTFAKAEAKAAGKSESDAKVWLYGMTLRYHHRLDLCGPISGQSRPVDFGRRYGW